MRYAQLVISLIAPILFSLAARANPPEPGAIANYVNSLIYEGMTTEPTWSKEVRYTSRNSHRDSFVRTQGSVTCTLMRFLYPQYRPHQQSLYRCNLENASIMGGSLSFAGEAAELLFKGMRKYFGGERGEIEREIVSFDIPGVGDVEAVYGRSLRILPVDGSFEERMQSEISCEFANYRMNLQAGGEFDEPTRQGLVPVVSNQYVCRIPLR